MPYEITISGIDTTFRKCIDWVTCKVDTPSTSNARTNFVGNYMNISGFIGTDEVTIDLYNWAILPVNDSNVLRNVQLTVKDANDNVIEKVSFPNAFVEFYRESYMRDKGLGKFNLHLKQKIDKNGDVGVSDSSPDEKVKSAAGSKIVESMLGNASESDILDTGAGKVVNDISEPSIEVPNGGADRSGYNPNEPLSPSNYPNPDPDFSAPPVRYEPNTIDEVIRMRQGKGPTTKSTHGDANIEAHHRGQKPMRDGGIMDELEEYTHRHGGNHTRHQLPSELTPTQRAKEIRDFYKKRGSEYILPGEGI